MATLEQRLQGTLGAQLLTIIKLETAVDDLQAENQRLAKLLADYEGPEQPPELEATGKDAPCSQQSQD